MYLLVSKFPFLGFRLLLSWVAPYYILLPRTDWLTVLEPVWRLRQALTMIDRKCEWLNHFDSIDWSIKMKNSVLD